MQATCTRTFSESFRHRELARGFICGASLQNSKEQWLFQQSGLIHLIVVSGGHLQILTSVLLECSPLWLRRRSRAFHWILGLILFAYCLMTGFQAPVVRALFSRLFSFLSTRWRWNWDASKSQIAAAALVLTLFPEWIHSLSFYLSWLASIGFLLSPLCFRYDRRGAKFSWLQLCLTCGLIQSFIAAVFGWFSWLGLMMNAVVATPLAVALIPLSLAPIIFKPATAIVDEIWDWLIKGLELSVYYSQTNSGPSLPTPNWNFLWAFLLGLLFLASILIQQRYRGSHV